MALVLEGSVFAAKGGTDMLQQRYQNMAAVATRQGVQQHPAGEEPDPGFFLRAIDFISRPLYAVTGVADVLMGTHEQESDKYIVSRVVRELFSGVGGLEGEKEFFGDVAEEAGIGEGGRLSDVIGENILTRRFDPTLRGTAAFALDIFADPLTYVGLGTVGRLSVISRGGKVTLSSKGERVLTHVMDHKTGEIARKLGRLRTMSDDTAKELGVKSTEGADALKLWEDAVGEVNRTTGSARKQAMAKKARIFHQIEMESIERAKHTMKKGADAQHRQVLLQDIRKSADKFMGKIISGELDTPTVRKILAKEGLNPDAVNLVDEASKLVERTNVHLHVPFGKPITLFELAESGRVNRAINYFTDPIKRRVIKILDSNDGTKQLLDYARQQRLPLQRTIHNLFNRDEFLAKDIDGYIMHKEDYFNEVQKASKELADDIEQAFADVGKKPQLIDEVTRFLERPDEDLGQFAAQAAEKHGVDERQVAEFVTWAKDRFETWGYMDVKNGVLDSAQYQRFRGRYVNHEINGWDQLTDRQKNIVTDLYREHTGRNMNINGATIGRYAEQRHFATIPELEEFLAKVNKELGTELTVNTDLKALMAHRGAATIEAAATTKFLNSVRRDFGRKKIMEEAGLLGAILPTLRGPVAARLTKKLNSDDIADLNELMSRSTTIASDNNVNYFGIPYKEAEKYGLDRGVVKFIDMMPETSGRDTVIEFVNVVRTTEDELGQAFQVLGSTRSAVKDDGTVRTIIRLYEGADVTTAAKELVGRRGWNLMPQEDRKLWGEFFEKTVKGNWIDPETGKPFANARDAFAQTAADVALGDAMPSSAFPEKFKAFSKLFNGLREVFQKFFKRVTELRSKMQTGEIPQEIQDVVRRAQTASPEGLDISGLGSEYWERFGGETLQRRRLGEGINIHNLSNEPLELASAVPDQGWTNAVRLLYGQLEYPEEAVNRNVDRLQKQRKSRPEDVRVAGDYYIHTDDVTGDTQWVSAGSEPVNPRMRLATPDGQIVTIGKKTSRDWVEEVIEGSTADELRQWVRWYRNEAKIFRDYFGEDDWKVQFAAAFMANQRMTPRAAFSMSLRQQWNAAATSDLFKAQDDFIAWAKKARDHNKAVAEGEISGPKHLVPDTLKAGDNIEKRQYIREVTAPGAALPTERLRDFFAHGVIEESDSQKLVDFLDSGLFKRTRTLYGDQEFAGDSAVIDVWSFLDSGYIDEERWKWIKRTFGDDVAKKVKQDGGITPSRYEMAADFLRQTQKYVRNNLDTIRSADGVLLKDIAADDEWGDLLEFASSFQAMGWMQKRKAAGIGAQFNQPTIASNIAEIPFEVAVGSSPQFKTLRGKWNQLSDVGKRRATAYLGSRVVEQAMQILGVPIEPRGHLGIGMWAGDLSPNITLSSPMAPENVEAMMSAVGYLADQDAMFAYMPRLNGKDAALDLVFDDPIAMQPQKFEAFLQDLNAEFDELFALDAKDTKKLTDVQKEMRKKARRDLTTVRQRQVDRRLANKMRKDKQFMRETRKKQVTFAEALKRYKEENPELLEEVKDAVWDEFDEPMQPFSGATGIGSPVQNSDGSFALRYITNPKFVRDGEKLKPEVEDIIRRVADRHGIKGLDIDGQNVDSALIERGEHGKGYLQRLESLGRREEVKILRRARKGIREEIERGIDAELKRDSRVRELKQPTIRGESTEIFFSDAVEGLPTLNPNQGFTISGSAARPTGGAGMYTYKAKIDDGLIYRPRAGEDVSADVLKQRGYKAFVDEDGAIELLDEVPVEAVGGQTANPKRTTPEDFQRAKLEISQADLLRGGVRENEFIEPAQLAKTLLANVERHENGALVGTDVADKVISMLPENSELRSVLQMFRPHIPKQTEMFIPWQVGSPPTWAQEGKTLLNEKARALHSAVPGERSMPVTGKRGDRVTVALRPETAYGVRLEESVGLLVPTRSPFKQKMPFPSHGVNFGTIVHELIHSATVTRISLLENLQQRAATQGDEVAARLWEKSFGDGWRETKRTYEALQKISYDLSSMAESKAQALLKKGDLNDVEKAQVKRLQHVAKSTAKGAWNAHFERVTYFLTEPVMRDMLNQSALADETHKVLRKFVADNFDFDEDTPLLESFGRMYANLEKTEIKADGLRLIKRAPQETRWTTEGFQRRKIDGPQMDARRRRGIAAKESHKVQLLKRDELQAEAEKQDLRAQELRRLRDEERLKRSGLEETRKGEQYRKLQARQAKAFDEAITARHGKGLAELDRLDQILAEETEAIRAQQPAFQPDLFSTGEVAAEEAEKVTKKQLKALRTRITKAKKRVSEELGAEFEEVLEAEARLAEYSVELGKKNYMIERLGEEIGERRARIQQLHEEAQVPRRRAQELRQEARSVAQGVKRPTIEDIKQQDAQRLRKLPQEAQAAYLYEGLNNIRTIEHLGKFLSKHEDIFMEIDPQALKQAREMIRSQGTEHAFSPYGRLNRPQTWKKVTIKTASGADEEWELPEGIADDLNRMSQKWLQQPEVRGALRLFDFGTNTFKGSVTVLFPAFHFRNAYSNVFQSALDIALQAFNPQRHIEALSIMVGGTPLGRKLGLPEITITDKFGNQYTSAHLRQLARDHQVATDFKALQEVVESGGYEVDKRGILKALTDVGDKISKPGRAAGTAIETEARMMHFITLIRRGVAPADAALQVKKFLFDYSNLSEFERGWMRRIFPFYTWNSKNLRLQIQQMIKKPGLVNNLHKGLMQARGPENDMLPEYLRGDLKVKLEPGPNKVAAFLTGIDLPTQAIDILFSGTVEETLRQNLGLINPLIKSPLEYAMNMNSFTGQSIRGAQYMNKLGPLIDKFPKDMKDWFELRKFPGSDGEMRYTANGTKVFLVFKSWALSRFMGTSAEFTKMLDSDEKVLRGWKLLTGMQIREFDLDEAQKNMLRARYERLEDQMIKRGLYMEYTRPYLHPEIKQQQIQATLGEARR